MTISHGASRRVRLWAVCWAALLLALGATWAVAAGPAIKHLTNDGRSYLEGRSPACQPHGTLVAYYRTVSESTRELMVLDLQTDKTHSISQAGWPFNSAWSPDGKKLSFLFADSQDPNSQVIGMIWDAQSGELSRTSFEGKIFYLAWYYGNSYLEFSPDNQQLAVEEIRPKFKSMEDLNKATTDEESGLDYFRVLIVPSGIGAITEPSPNSRTCYFNSDQYVPAWQVWSPEGRLVYTAQETNGDAQVWTCDARGQNPVAVTPRYKCIQDAMWSPDGRQIAFRSAQDRPQSEIDAWLTDLWVVNADGSNPHALTHGASAEVAKRKKWVPFAWTATGEYLLCWTTRYDETGAQRNVGYDLVSAKDGELVPVAVYDTQATDMFQPSWDNSALSPDGQRVAMIGLRYRTRTRSANGKSWVLGNPTKVLEVFDIPSRKSYDLIELNETQEGLILGKTPEHASNTQLSWTSDGRHLLVEESKIISATEHKYDRDLYLVDLPPELPPIIASAPAPQPTPAEGATPPPGVTGNETLPPAEGQTTPAAPSEAGTATTGGAGPAAPAAPALPAVVLVVPSQQLATEIAEALPDIYRGIYKIHPGLNAFVVSTADPVMLENFRQDVARLDQEVPQVMVDVLVTELSGDASKELGFDWQFARGRWGATLPTLDTGGTGGAIYQGVGKLDQRFYVTLSALQQQGAAKIYTDPRVIARCGKSSSISIRKVHNFFYQSGSYEGIVSFTKSDISANIILKMTPQVLGSGRIHLDLDVTIETFTFASATALPDTANRQVQCDGICGDGDSFIIGGLTQEEQSKTVTKTPLLGDLPFIGQLFRQTTRTSRQTTMVIFVTPHVVTTTNQPAPAPAATPLAPGTP